MKNLTITWETIAWLLAAIVLIGTAAKTVIPLFSPFRKINEKVKEHDEQLKKDFSRLNAKDECDKVILRGLLACLKGLKERGCNGPVTQGIKDIEDYLIQK